jgi:hypothetical protein
VKRAQNPFLGRIASLVGEIDPGRAVPTFVATHRGPKESLENLARKLGVNRIIEQKLPFEGGLFQLSDSELVIKLNSESSFVRKRFTLAHELGHLLLKTVPAFRSSNRTDAALERACDKIASELLMPTDDAVNFIKNLGQPSPEKLRFIARKYAVSLQTAAIRLYSDFQLWKCFIGCWERHPQIKTVWFVGHRRWDRVEPDSYSLDLALSSDTPVHTEELWQRGPSADRVWLNLLRDGNERVLGLIGFVNRVPEGRSAPGYRRELV